MPKTTSSLEQLARLLAGKEKTKSVRMTGSSVPTGMSTYESEIRLLPRTIGDPGDVLTVVTNGDGDDVPSWETPTGGSGTITVQEGDVDVDTSVTTIDFDGSDFNVSSSPSGEANISLAYGTSAGTPAEGNHTHVMTIVVQEGDVDVDTAVTTLDFDDSDFNVASSPSGEANISLNYGTGAGQPAEGNHTHAGSTITVQEGDVDVDTNVTTIDFDASDFNVSSSPAGEANISLAYGTSAGTPAEGNHVHTNDHVAATVLDSTSIDFSLSGQQITGDVILEWLQDTVAAMFTGGSHSLISVAYNDGAGTVGITNGVDDVGVSFNAGDGVNVITASISVYVLCPWSGTITGWDARAQAASSVTTDIYKAPRGSTTFTKISSTTGPSLSSAAENNSTSLSGWTTAITAGDTLRMDITGTPTTATKFMASLSITRTS